MLDAIRILAVLGWEAGAALAGQLTPRNPEPADAEILDHLAAVRALLEDVRNILNHQTPDIITVNNVSDAACGGAATPKVLRAAARGLRAWGDGDVCDAIHYWRAIANSLDNVAEVRDAINKQAPAK